MLCATPGALHSGSKRSRDRAREKEEREAILQASNFLSASRQIENHLCTARESPAGQRRLEQGVLRGAAIAAILPVDQRHYVCERERCAPIEIIVVAGSPVYGSTRGRSRHYSCFVGVIYTKFSSAVLCFLAYHPLFRTVDIAKYRCGTF
jgi:hypothetical protein